VVVVRRRAHYRPTATACLLINKLRPVVDMNARVVPFVNFHCTVNECDEGHKSSYSVLQKVTLDLKYTNCMYPGSSSLHTAFGNVCRMSANEQGGTDQSDVAESSSELFQLDIPASNEWLQRLLALERKVFGKSGAW
jgi:hypothetical protein